MRRSILLFAISLFTLMSCEPWDLDRKPEANILLINDITAFSALVSAEVSVYQYQTIMERGICWNTEGQPSLADSIKIAGTGAGYYNCLLTNLDIETKYYIRPWARGDFGTIYGPEETFTTLEGGNVPILFTNPANSVTETTALAGGKILHDGGNTVTLRGICFSTDPNPDINTDTLCAGSGEGSFKVTLSGLFTLETYYLRAFAVNSTGVYYGQLESFTTLPGTSNYPALSTATPFSVTQTTAISGGTIYSSGESAIIKRGICYGKSPYPDLSGMHTDEGIGIGSFSSILDQLDPGSLYYIRAFASNNTLTAYGNQLTFTTLGPTNLPVVHTEEVTAITQSSCMTGGFVTSDGGSSVTARGICRATHPNPSITDEVLTVGSGSGGYSCTINGLSNNTVYYLRAFAINASGTAYGEVKTLTTLSVFMIGQYYQGGVIFYLDTSGIHGLVAAPNDQAIDTPWGCDGTNLPGADGLNIGSGNNNTLEITSQCSESDIAARICFSLQMNGYSDWYLPSRDELNLLYLNKNLVGNFQTTFYWSSSEVDAEKAWKQNFVTGAKYTYYKYDPISVRAIRSF